MKILKKLGRITFWLFMLLLAFVAICTVVLWSASPGKTEPISDASGKLVENSIAEVLHVPINGLDQFLIIRGKSLDNPVLLMLHGGPGSPQAHMNLLHNKILEDYYIVVNWDQRGAGASYEKNIPVETMNIKQFVDDTYQVTEYLKRRFNKDKIFLLGHSWGSYLGMRTIYEHPEEYYAYIGIGQVSNQRKSEDLSYAFAFERAKATNNLEAIEDLEAIGAPVNGEYKNPFHDIQVQRKWVTEFGGAAYGLSSKDFFGFFIKPLLLCREYKMAEKLNYTEGMMFTQTLMWNQLLNHQLVDEVKEVQIPVYILQGVHDYQTVYAEAKNYIDSLKAPQKEFITFENSAHLPPYNLEKDKFHRIMIEQVLKEYRP